MSDILLDPTDAIDRGQKAFAPRLDTITNIQTRSVVCVPIRGRDRVLGVIELVASAEQRRVGKRDLDVVQFLVVRDKPAPLDRKAEAAGRFRIPRAVGVWPLEGIE